MRKMNILLVGALSMFVMGCSAKYNYYQLHPKTGSNTEGHISKKGIVIGIGEVEVPDYLNKPEMVTRLSAGRISVHEKERWAGSLPKNIQYVLMSNLSAQLPKYTFLQYPWEEPVSDKYRIYVIIDSFDGSTDGVVALKGRWSLVSEEDNKVLFGESFRYTQKSGKTLDSIVDAQSRLIEKLSRGIAAKIRSRI